MNFYREAWRPLFLREPVAQRGWTLVTRGVRAYLLRVAEDDGTLLKRCADPFELASSLGVHPDEQELVRHALATLLEDGFLRWEGTGESPGWLGVDRLVTFGGEGPLLDQDADDSPGGGNEPPHERRRRLARERKERFLRRQQERSAERSPSVPSVPSVPSSVPESVPENAQSVPGSVPGSVPESVPSVLSPHSPLSEYKNQQKNRTDRRGEPSGRARKGTRSEERSQRSSQRSGERSSERSARNAPTPLPAFLRKRRGGSEPVIDLRAEHRRFAAQYAIDLDAIEREIPRYEALSPGEQRQALMRALMRAAAERDLQEQAS